MNSTISRLLSRTWGLCALAAFVASAQAGPVFVNGSFETPNLFYQAPGGGSSSAITGWTTALSGVEHYNSPAYGVGAAADGVMAVDLAYYTSLAGGAIEQALQTVAGETYTVNFFAGNSINGGRTGTGVVKISIDGSHLVDIDTPNATTVATVWAQRSFSFTASGSNSVVRFWNVQNPFLHYALIDGVSVAEPGTGGNVPEPGSLILASLGLIGLAATRRKQV
jgi:hypothetical protein